MIAHIAPDFTLLDVWALPVHGGPEDFASLLEVMGDLDVADSGPVTTRALFAVRYRIGGWFGWDEASEPRPIPGCGETTLSVRLPEPLRGSAASLAIGNRMQRAAGGFVPLYRTHDEWAAEISNGTVHGVMHVGWVEQSQGQYRAQMGVYVKPRGRLGEIYLKLIEPFRHLIVYPALTRYIGRAWDLSRDPE